MLENSAYLFIEIAVFITILLISNSYCDWEKFISNKFAITLFGLFILWFIIEQIAINLGVWSFPIGNTSSIRLLNVPIEEYFLMIINTFYCLMLLEIFNND